MPAWPLVCELHQGLARLQPARDVWPSSSRRPRPPRRASARRSPRTTLPTIKSDPELLRFALAGGEAAFGDNCAPCHGRGAQGAFGYPNLSDDDWLWGDGTLDAIHQTIQHGVRADDPETRMPAQMPAFGTTGCSTEPQIADVAEYVLSLSGQGRRQGGRRARAPRSSPTIARRCHGAEGKGNQQLGAPRPRPTSSGSMEATRRRSSTRITQRPRRRDAGLGGRLDPETIKELAIYVHSLGGGQ